MRERREGQKKEQNLRQKKRQKRERLLSIAAALVLWQILSMAVGQKIILVSPITAAARLGELAREGDFWLTVGFSFLRIEAGFFLGLIAVAGLTVAVGLISTSALSVFSRSAGFFHSGEAVGSMGAWLSGSRSRVVPGCRATGAGAGAAWMPSGV